MKKLVNLCGVSLDECPSNLCTYCGSCCEVRPQDILDERLYKYCKSHGCLRNYSRGVMIYNENDFMDYLLKHPKELERLKWLREFVAQKGWNIK